MKKNQFLLVAILSFINISYTFSQDYMSIITNEACECLSEIKETSDSEKFNMQLGLCIIEAATPYRSKLKADHKIDLDNIVSDGKKLGELIGFRMASVCPNEILRATQGDIANEEVENELYYVTGSIVKIEKDQFVVISIKDDVDGKTSKYYWLTYVSSEMDFATEYQKLIGKKVETYYIINDLIKHVIS